MIDYKGLLIFAGGVFVGVASSAFILHDYYDSIYEEKYESLKKNMEKYEREQKEKEKKEEYQSSSDNSNTGRENGNLPREDRIRIKESWSEEGPFERVDYTKFYVQKDKGGAFKEPENTKYTVTEDGEENIAKYTEDSRRIHMPPKIATEREVAMLPKDVYSFENMSYYVYDDVLLLTPDMDEWTVVDPEDYLGDCLTVHGFDHNNEETLYVINYLDQTVYKVNKKWNYYKR